MLLLHNTTYFHTWQSIGSTGPFDGAGGFGLEFPADGIINPSNPTPCSASDSRDYVYIEGLLDFIADHPGLDSSKVYFEGFSQNSMFSLYASVCFADRVAGLFQGGSGISKTFHLPITPGLQAQCSASAFATHGNNCCNGTWSWYYILIWNFNLIFDKTTCCNNVLNVEFIFLLILFSDL